MAVRAEKSIGTCRDCGAESVTIWVQNGHRCSPCLQTIRRKHYQNRHPQPDPLEYDTQRFWSFVLRGNGCWMWTGPTTEDGYGRFYSRYFGDRIRSHRFSYFLKNGCFPEPNGCHKCDTPLCVRPDHIFPGTHADNIADMEAKGRVGDRRVFGVRNAKAKLTKDKVLEIVNRYRGGEGLSILGRSYGITPQSVSAIVKGKNWVHVTGLSSSK